LRASDSDTLGALTVIRIDAVDHSSLPHLLSL
jgi:hypothetical protein